MSAHRFTDAQIAQYREQGFVIAPALFDADEVVAAHRTIDQITDRAIAAGDWADVLELEPGTEHTQPIARRIYNPFNAHDTFRNMALDDRVLDRLEQLLGPDLHFHHSKLNMKPARVGSVVEWHQDLSYFPHTNDDLLAALIYLDDTTIANGCLQVMPGRHKAFLNHTTADGLFAGMITEDLSDGRYGTPVPCEAPAGSVIFMHCLTPHSSLPNTSDTHRRTLIFEYRAADAFPIYFDQKMTVKNESHACQVRGKPATTARFGTVPPLIPRFPGMVTSLYDLQQQTRKRADMQRT